MAMILAEEVGKIIVVTPQMAKMWLLYIMLTVIALFVLTLLVRWVVMRTRRWEAKPGGPDMALLNRKLGAGDISLKEYEAICRARQAKSAHGESQT
jgi:uncharacterized membrane protein